MRSLGRRAAIEPARPPPRAAPPPAPAAAIFRALPSLPPSPQPPSCPAPAAILAPRGCRGNAGARGAGAAGPGGAAPGRRSRGPRYRPGNPPGPRALAAFARFCAISRPEKRGAWPQRARPGPGLRGPAQAALQAPGCQSGAPREPPGASAHRPHTPAPDKTCHYFHGSQDSAVPKLRVSVARSDGSRTADKLLLYRCV